MEIISLFLVIICVVTYLKYLWDQRWLYYYSFKINGPFAYPIIGSALCLLQGLDDNAKYLSYLFATYGEIFKIWLGGNLIIFTNNPKNIKTILNNCMEKDPHYQFGKCLVGEGLFTASGNKWKHNRKVMALLFNPRILNSFFNIFVDYSNILVKQMEKNLGGKEHFNIYPLIQQYTLDIVCETSLGVKVNAMIGDSKYGYWMARAEALIVHRFFMLYLHPEIIWKMSKKYKQVEDLTKKSWNFVRTILEQKQQKKNKMSFVQEEECSELNNDLSKLKTKCFLDYLCEISEDITNNELIEEAQTMVIAGSETTATAESTILLMLALHQDVQKKVHEELDEIFDGNDREVVLEDLSQMKYLERVIKESLRLFPVAPILARIATKDIELDSIIIPKGASIMIPIIGLHRNSNIWPDPLRFDPDRFLPEESANRHTHAFIPFAAGPRNCIGMRYALMSIKIMLATVLRRYRIVSSEYTSIQDIKLRFNIINKFRKGHPIKIEFRQ